MSRCRLAKHEKFCQSIVSGVGVLDSHVAAGYPRNRGNANRLKNLPHIQARIEELMAPAIEATGVTVADIVQELKSLAFYDITDVLEVSGKKVTLRNPKTLPEELRRAIVSIKPVEIGKKIHYQCRFGDKQKALETLGRHLQMFKDTVIVENVFTIVMEMGDSELDRRLAELERAFAEATTLDPSAGEDSTGLH